MVPDWLVIKSGLVVFLGGGVGAFARWSISRACLGAAWVESFPWPTFFINAVGSFILGLFVPLANERPVWYALLGVGFCGGFTTFSTFSVELVKLLQSERFASAFAYAVGSVLAALAGAWLGMGLVRR